MQTSGMAPQFSDGMKKQIVGTPKVAKVSGKQPMTPAPMHPPNPHRRGGHAKHQKGGK